MIYLRPHTLLAGIQADAPDGGVPELIHVGEQWSAAYPPPPEPRRAWQFFLQAQGSASWDVGGNVFPLRAGQFLAAPPHAAPRPVGSMKSPARARHHAYVAGVHLGPVLERHPALRAVWEHTSCVYVRSAGALEEPFRRLVREVSMTRQFRASGLRTALDSLVIEATRLFHQSGPRGAPPAHPAVRQAKELMDSQCRQPWLLADLGRVVGLSPNHLVLLFTREVGLSPHKYLVRRRIEEAKELLRTTAVPVAELAQSLGFASGQHFAKIFRQSVHCPALAYRQRFRGKGRRRGSS